LAVIDEIGGQQVIVAEHQFYFTDRFFQFFINLKKTWKYDVLGKSW